MRLNKLFHSIKWRKSIWYFLGFVFLAFVAWKVYWRFYSAAGWEDWTGFDEFFSPTGEYYRAKTLWDWLELLIVPTVIALGAWFLNKNERKTEREIAQRREALDREIARTKQRQDTLEAYFDRISGLLLEMGLRGASPDDEVMSIARTRTLAVLRNIDGERKGQVIRFLYESGLLGEHPAINITGADLSEIDLRGAHLSGINLCNTYLVRANFSHATLPAAVFSDAQLMESNFTHADLTDAIFSRADLSKAILESAILEKSDFSGANLNKAKLIGATLVEANLRANMEGADFRNADLSRANLEGANLMSATISNNNEETTLTGANLSYANLIGARLDGAVLYEANLFGAKLLMATLTNAYFGKANLSQASVDSLKRVSSLHEATLPDWTKHDGTVILSRITYSHVLKAIKELSLSESYPSFFHQIEEPYVAFRGKRYFLIYLIPYAYESNDDLTYDVFNMREAIKHLTSLGFVVKGEVHFEVE